ncbi:RluA family pseudouridine synthase [Salinivirga cyanobacteriivorans]
MKLDILYEDNHLIAVNKPVGMLVQGDESGDKSLLDEVAEYLKKKYNKPGNVFTGLVHRIDRPVSGVVLIARTSKALARMNELLRNRDIKREYWALVKDKPEKLKDTLKHYLRKDESKNKSFASFKQKKGSKLAVLDYEVAGRSSNYYLIKVNLRTGRHHQIRCQLAKIKTPIRGDLKYGFPRSNKGGGINLHAKKLEFVHPVKQEKIIIEAPLPLDDNLWREFDQLA